MTNKEILAELKMSYEYLRDIRENGCIDHCNGQMKDNIDKLEIAISNIIRVYDDFYNTLDKEELKINKKCFYDELYISSDVSADYDVYDKNGNEDDITYCTCEDIDYYWYKDEDFILN